MLFLGHLRNKQNLLCGNTIHIIIEALRVTEYLDQDFIWLVQQVSVLGRHEQHHGLSRRVRKHFFNDQIANLVNGKAERSLDRANHP
jgi:hypothetical protein